MDFLLVTTIKKYKIRRNNIFGVPIWTCAPSRSSPSLGQKKILGTPQLLDRGCALESEKEADHQMNAIDGTANSAFSAITQFVEDNIDLHIVYIYGNTPFH